jgi:hypothetical protein
VPAATWPKCTWSGLSRTVVRSSAAAAAAATLRLSSSVSRISVNRAAAAIARSALFASRSSSPTAFKRVSRTELSIPVCTCSGKTFSLIVSPESFCVTFGIDETLRGKLASADQIDRGG